MVGIFTAAALALSFLESLLPPVPGMPPGAKLGLSNIVTMLAARELGLFYALFIAVMKAGFAFLTRGATAFFMSLVGGLFSAFAAYLLLHSGKQPFGTLGIGICSALMHNLGQLLVALVLLGKAILYYLPFLMLFSVITGSVTGIVLQRLPHFSDRNLSQ